MMSMDSLQSCSVLKVGSQAYEYFDLPTAAQNGLGDLSRMPISLKILLENLLRSEDGNSVALSHIESLANWRQEGASTKEIAYRPARVLMQDFTGVPAVADLAAMRSATVAAGADPELINPLSPVDLVIDHSVMVDHFGSDEAFAANVDKEMARNGERYRFLRWGQQAFENFRVVPPGTGICHQVNLEYLARVVWTRESEGSVVAFPDTLVGTDSHTTMVNALGVLGWGVGGIEAEAAMLGQPISMLIPEVVGVRLSGELSPGTTATDLVLQVVELLRGHGVVGKFVEFFGPALEQLSLADRATIANMAPEYGATCGFFPVDDETLRYMRLSSRSEDTVALVEAYTKQQGMWRDENAEPEFDELLHLDLSEVESSLAGPKRPQDRVPLTGLSRAFDDALALSTVGSSETTVGISNQDYSLSHGDVVIAAITSCTNTSNPAVMLAAGLVARNAIARGLKVKPWVKTSLAPGSKVVTEYLEKTGLQNALDEIGFNLVGYGCTTCIGNSGPLPVEISEGIAAGNLMVSAVLSGNRNFEGRVHQEVKANWLASPPLVVAFALAGTTRIDLSTQPIGRDNDGVDVFLRDIWPSENDVAEVVEQVTSNMFKSQYEDVFSGPEVWQSIAVDESSTYGWDESTYIKQPPFFSAGGDANQSIVIEDARILAILGDSVTTDHISPAGAIQPASPAGEYLQQRGVQVAEFNSYGSRRGNHEVMMRGTFANIRIKNEMLDGVEGGFTKHISTSDQISIYDAAMRYEREGIPLVVFAGKEYGTGSSRDWAAKGTRLLGIKAVIVESFERIHRSNLVGIGVLPLELTDSATRKSLELDGTESISIGFSSVDKEIKPRQTLQLTIKRANGETKQVSVLSRLDTDNEIAYYKCGGILQYVLNNLIQEAS